MERSVALIHLTFHSETFSIIQLIQVGWITDVRTNIDIIKPTLRREHKINIWNILRTFEEFVKVLHVLLKFSNNLWFLHPYIVIFVT